MSAKWDQEGMDQEAEASRSRLVHGFARLIKGSFGLIVGLRAIMPSLLFRRLPLPRCRPRRADRLRAGLKYNDDEDRHPRPPPIHGACA